MMTKMIEMIIVGHWFGFRFEFPVWFMSVVESRSMLIGICTNCSAKREKKIEELRIKFLIRSRNERPG